MSTLKTLRQARRAMYRGGARLGDLEAVASGDPRKMAARLWRRWIWRMIGRATR